MTWALAHWRALSVALGLAAAFASGRLTARKPPAPAVALHEDTASQRASASASDTSDSKGAARITTTTEEFDDGAARRQAAALECQPPGSPGHSSGVAPAVPHTEHPTRRTVTVEERGPEVITQHATEQATVAEQSHVSLVVTPSAERPGWAVGGSIEDLPGARLLRLELDRRLFGNLWVTAGIVPARRELGIGLRMEF